MLLGSFIGQWRINASGSWLSDMSHMLTKEINEGDLSN